MKIPGYAGMFATLAKVRRSSCEAKISLSTDAFEDVRACLLRK